MNEKFYYDIIWFKSYKFLVISSKKGLVFSDFIVEKKLWANFEKFTKITFDQKRFKYKKHFMVREVLEIFTNKGYLNIKKITFDLRGTDFQMNVWSNLLKSRPKSLFTYQDFAKMLPQPSATRAVANAIAKNPLLIFIPCHLIVGKLNLFSYRAGRDIKKMLINSENFL